MMNTIKRCCCTLLLVASVLTAAAQGRPIGLWRSHLPYNHAISVVSSGSKLFVATQQSFFTYDVAGKETSTYSKVEGMSDVGMSWVGYDPATDMAVLTYVNSNIDLFQNETFYNIPYLKLKTITGDKKVYNIYCQSGYAYLCTGIGVLVLNLTKKEVKETYTFSRDGQTLAVKGITGASGYFYAVAGNNLFKTAQTNPSIQSSSTWKCLDSSRAFIGTVNAGGHIYVAKADSLFELAADTLRYAYKADSAAAIQHIDSVNGGLAISVFASYKSRGMVYIMDHSYKVVDSMDVPNSYQVAQTADNRLWAADIFLGLRTKDQTITPLGPSFPGTFDIIANNKKLYVAHGAYDDKWNIKLDQSGFSIFDNESWQSFTQNNTPALSPLRDAVRLAIDPADQTLYIASLVDGLYYMKADKTFGLYRDGYFEPNLVDPFSVRISGVTFDQYGTLWASQINAPHELVARSSAGDWYKFSLPAYWPRPYWAHGAADVMVDDYNQKWFFSPVGGGVLIYNDQNTLSDPSDDRYYQLTMGVGQGNLPDNNVNCLVNDKKSTIWIGTANGIGIVNCPSQVIGGQCDAEIRVVQYDQFAGYLFAGQNVKTIAVDGANRKWVGTNDGVWLISDDAGKVLQRFTVDNSPLPSNTIQVIRIDPVTGDVYIGTDQGLVSYRSTATEGGTTNSNVKVYPNPVPSGYSGTIAIRGLVENADVRITDISGQLVYRTKALGGQAIWNGLDYTGRRPQSGVFLIFVSNSTGTETTVEKMVFIK